MPGVNKGGHSTKRSVGAYGSKRGTPDKQVARARHRETQGRNKEAMAEVKAEREKLERRIAREASAPAEGETAGARYAREQEQQARLAELRAIEEEHDEWLRRERDRDWDRKVQTDNRLAEVAARHRQPKEEALEFIMTDPQLGVQRRKGPRPKSKYNVAQLCWDGDGTSDKAVAEARRMLTQGYHVMKVMKSHGVGYRWLDDLPIDDDGFGMSLT